MRTRKITRGGRLSALFMAFLIAFSSASTYTVQTVEAAVSSADIHTEEELNGMLSVGTVVKDDWKYDSRLKELLTQRDLEAAEYARENNITGTYNTSGSLGSFGASDTSGEWLSNVLYQGDILRSDSFDGFIAVYDDGADAAVIEAGINEIDVLLIPISDLSVSYNGIETDIATWETVPGFASRFMLPHWNGQDGLNLKNKTAYRTRLFVVGIQGGMLSKGSIYDKGKMLDYAKYLDYIGAEPNAANLASYMDYMRTFQSITEDEDEYQDDWDDWDEWYEWYEEIQRNASRSTGGRGSSTGEPSRTVTPSTPVITKKGRTIMVYMDGADLGSYALDNLKNMLDQSKQGSIGTDNHIVIMTGGSKSKWDNAESDITAYLYDSNGTSSSDLAARLGIANQLWELKNVNGTPKLVLLQDNFNAETDGTLSNGQFMTDGANLKAFIQEAEKRYPDAKLYDLIMWDHGGGPEGGFGMDERRKDATNKDDESMTLVAMTNAIKDSGVNFDFIAFDACLMGNTEVALALAPYSDYLILSELVFPGAGFDDAYKTIVKKLSDNNNIDTLDYANAIASDAVYSYNYDTKTAMSSRQDATLAVIETSKVSDNVSKALGKFAEAVSKAVRDKNEQALDLLLRTRKMYVYEESKFSQYGNDLIDIQNFCEALITAEKSMVEQEGATYKKVFTDACTELQQAAKVSLGDDGENNARFYYNWKNDKYLETAQGTEATGLSIYFPSYSMMVTPKDTTTGKTTTDQVLDLIYAYTSSNDSNLTSYGKSLAAYGLWLKVGKMLGSKTFWLESDDADDEKVISDVKDQESDEWKIDYLVKASGLSTDPNDTTVDDLIAQQVKDRIKASNIHVVQVTDDNGIDITGQKNVNIFTSDPDIVNKVKVEVYTKDSSGKKISLGTSNFYDLGSTNQTEDGKQYSSHTIQQYDNKWLTIGDKAVSYYDTERRTIKINNVDTEYRVGIIPVAYWQEQKDTTKTVSLKDAISNGLVKLGVLEVRFPITNTQTDTFSDTGTVTNFRYINESSLSMTGFEINQNDIFELLAGFDNGEDTSNTSNLRSIGVIQAAGSYYNSTAKTMTAKFQLVNDLAMEYKIVDAYESTYELNGENFDAKDESGNVTATSEKNLDNFRDTATNGTGTVTVATASTDTASWTGLNTGNFENRDTKSADGNSADAANADATDANTADDGTSDIAALEEAETDDTAGAGSTDESSVTAGSGLTETGAPDTGAAAVPDTTPVTITSAQQAFLANIEAGLQTGTITLEQAAALIGEAGILPGQVDAYTAGTAVVSDSPVAADPAAAAAPVTDPVSDPALVATDPAASDPTAVIATDPTVVVDPSLAATDPASVTGTPAATGLDGGDPASDVSSSYVDAAPPEGTAYTSDDSGSGDTGSGGDGGSSDGGSDSGSSDDSSSDDSGSDDGGSSDGDSD